MSIKVWDWASSGPAELLGGASASLTPAEANEWKLSIFKNHLEKYTKLIDLDRQVDLLRCRQSATPGCLWSEMWPLHQRLEGLKAEFFTIGFDWLAGLETRHEAAKAKGLKESDELADWRAKHKHSNQSSE